uniref:Uncharacterized protein n=1 Tax=Brassica campestris TaxID=3711 RepID=A0A3P5Z1I4_BRACM|nr:unnamed protein product [Brassica rapa]
MTICGALTMNLWSLGILATVLIHINRFLEVSGVT